jgi:peptide/nickel transport system permease protein
MRKEISQSQRMWLAFPRNRTAIAGWVIGVLIFLTSIFAPWIAPCDPLDQDPIFRLEPGTAEHTGWARTT